MSINSINQLGTCFAIVYVYMCICGVWRMYMCTSYIKKHISFSSLLLFASLRFQGNALSEGLLFEDAIRCKYKDFITKAKLIEAAVAIAPIVSKMHFENAAASCKQTVVCSDKDASNNSKETVIVKNNNNTNNNNNENKEVKKTSGPKVYGASRSGMQLTALQRQCIRTIRQVMDTVHQGTQYKLCT